MDLALAIKNFQKKLREKQSGGKGYTVIEMKLGKNKNSENVAG